MKRHWTLVLAAVLLVSCGGRATPTAVQAPTSVLALATATATLMPATAAPLPPTRTPLATATRTSLPPTPTPQPTLSALQAGLKLAGQVSPQRLMADVTWLADDARRGRLTGTPEEDAVGAWLVQRFQELGLRPFADLGLASYSLPFSAPALTRYGRTAPGETAQGENVIGVLPGAVQPDRYICIAAHYDHVGVRQDGQVNNGADDDATGVAAVLEAARLLSQAGMRPRKTLVFVSFSGEELGGLGSRAMCAQLSARGVNTRAMLLNMEVLGARKGAGTYLDVWDEGVSTTAPLVDALAAAAAQLGVRVERKGRDPGSDALQLLECSVPAVSVDVAWSPENHPHYHRPSDDPGEIDADGLANATRVAVAALWLLAN